MSFWGDFKSNVETIKSIGYQGLELFVRDPQKMDVADVQAIIRESGLEVAAIGTNPAMSQDGLTLLHRDEDIRNQAVKRIMEMITFAAHWGAPVCIGKYRGQLWQDQPEESMKILTEEIVRICDYGAENGVAIMIEPQNKYNINNLNTTGETVRWIKQNQIENIHILYDTYHGDLAETSVAAGILNAGDKLGFVHCSDINRLPPGAGRIHMADAFAVLAAKGYDGYISMEIEQKPDSKTAAELAYKTVSYVLDYVL